MLNNRYFILCFTLLYSDNAFISFTVGYRYLDIEFKEDEVLYDVTLDGIYLGPGIHF